MCTLIVLHRCVPGRPLVVAANRDEFHARPAEGPAVRETRAGRILAPLDLEAGGTWLGLNDRGVFAALTNLRPWSPGKRSPDGSDAYEVDATLRSRGEIVMDALEADTADEAARRLERLVQHAAHRRTSGDDRRPGARRARTERVEEPRREYNPFQLVVADGRSAWQLVYGAQRRLDRLEPGVHVVGNVEDERIARRPTEARAQKLGRVRTRAEKLVAESRAGGDLLEELAGLCREHIDGEHVDPPGPPGARSAERRRSQDPGDAVEPFRSEVAARPTDAALASTCVHVGDVYGTRSSLLLELSDDVDAGRVWASAGPPCEAPYEDLSPLLRELDVRSTSRSAAEPQARTNG